MLALVSVVWFGASCEPRFEVLGQSLGDCKSDLAAFTNTKIQISKDLENEAVLLVCDSSNKSKLLRKVADAVGADWERAEDGTLLLRRTPAHLLKLRSEWVEHRLKVLTHACKEFKRSSSAAFSIETAKKRIAELQSLTEQKRPDWIIENQIESLQNASPAAFLARRLAASINLRPAADSEDDQRVVFSSDPVPGQHQLPAMSAGEFEKLRQESTVLADTLISKLGTVARYRNMFSAWRSDSSTGTPAKATLTARKRGDQWTLRLFDESGNQIDAYSFVLARTDIGTPSTNIDPKILDMPIDYSAATEDLFVTVEGRRNSEGETVFESERIRRSLLDAISTFEPLDYAPRDVHMALAKSVEGCIALAVSDSSWLQKPRTIRDAIALLGVSEDRDGWLVSPTLRYEHIKQRVSRSTLRLYLQTLASGRGDAAEAKLLLWRMGIDSDAYERGDPAARAVYKFTKAITGRLTQFGAPRFACICAADQQVQASSQANGKAKFRELPRALRESLNVYFNSYSSCTLAMMDTRIRYAEKGWYREPTNAWGYRVPDEAILLTENRESLYFVNDSSIPKREISLRMLAEEIVCQERGLRYLGLASHEKFIVGTRHDSKFTLFSGDFQHSAVISDLKVVDGTPKEWRQFPGDLLSKLKVEIDAVRGTLPQSPRVTLPVRMRRSSFIH